MISGKNITNLPKLVSTSNLLPLGSIRTSPDQSLALRDEYYPQSDGEWLKSPEYQQPPPPPESGFRIPLASDTQFPPSPQAREPVCTHTDGVSPVFVGSAVFNESVHPCKIIPSLPHRCRVPYGGEEIGFRGRCELLPITPEMEWVPTREGKIPQGRRPVQGGHESNGEKLYHALGVVDTGLSVPGKTGEHLVRFFS
jgi:hypothetical protein